MDYYHRTAGRAQGKMLVYAKNNLDEETYNEVIKANKKVLVGMYIYIALLFLLLFVPLILLGKISSNIIYACLFVACISPIIYFILYFKTFGKDWNKYVKWYTKTDKKIPFSFENRIVLNDKLKIKEIRGGSDFCIITFETGEKLRCKGNLAMPGTEKFYITELPDFISKEEKKIFINIFNKYLKERKDSFVELSVNSSLE